MCGDVLRQSPSEGNEHRRFNRSIRFCDPAVACAGRLVCAPSLISRAGQGDRPPRCTSSPRSSDLYLLFRLAQATKRWRNWVLSSEESSPAWFSGEATGCRATWCSRSAPSRNAQCRCSDLWPARAKRGAVVLVRVENISGQSHQPATTSGHAAGARSHFSSLSGAPGGNRRTRCSEHSGQAVLRLHEKDKIAPFNGIRHLWRSELFIAQGGTPEERKCRCAR